MTSSYRDYKIKSCNLYCTVVLSDDLHEFQHYCLKEFFTNLHLKQLVFVVSSNYYKFIFENELISILHSSQHTTTTK